MACRGRFAEHDYRIFLDWLDPPFAAGHWVPDIISWIGCTSVLAQSGEPSHEISWRKCAIAVPILFRGLLRAVGRNGQNCR